MKSAVILILLYFKDVTDRIKSKIRYCTRKKKKNQWTGKIKQKKLSKSKQREKKEFSVNCGSILSYLTYFCLESRKQRKWKRKTYEMIMMTVFPNLLQTTAHTSWETWQIRNRTKFKENYSKAHDNRLAGKW